MSDHLGTQDGVTIESESCAFRQGGRNEMTSRAVKFLAPSTLDGWGG